MVGFWWNYLECGFGRLGARGKTQLAGANCDELK